MKRTLTSLGFFLAVCLLVQSAAAQTTAFTYQGRLMDNGAPANGSYDLQFALRDALSAGNPVGSAVVVAPVGVTNGLFTVTLDFGTGVFPGANRWLEIGVRTNSSSGAYTTLAPRQPITSTPYAIQALSAATAGSATTAASVPAAGITGTFGDARLSANVAFLNGTNIFIGTNNFAGIVVLTNANNQVIGIFSGNGAGLTNIGGASIASGSISNTHLANGAITAAKISSGQVVKSVNALTDDVVLSAGTNVSLATNGNTITISAGVGGTGISPGAANPLRIALARWYDKNMVTTFSAPGAPNGMTFDGTHIWVANILNNNISKIRASDGAVIGTFPTLDRPRSVCFDGANVWVTGEPGGLAKIRASDGVSLTNNTSNPGSYFACVFDGKNVWTRAGRALNKINTADATVAASYNIDIDGGLSGAVFDGSYLWVAGTDIFSGGKAAKVRPSDGAVIGTYTVGSNPRGITFDGQYIWTANFGSATVTKLRASDGSTVGTFNVPNQPWDLIFDGVNILVAHLNANIVTQLRAADGTALSTNTVNSPFRLAFDGANVWISNISANTVTKF